MNEWASIKGSMQKTSRTIWTSSVTNSTGGRLFDSDCSGDPLQVYKQISTLKTVMKQFAGKNIIITGGSKGIGRSVVEIFLKEGANVSILDFDPVAKELEGKNAKFFYCNVSKSKDIKEAVTKAISILEM